MARNIIQVSNLSKRYRLGEVGSGTLSHDLNRWWARARGKEDPMTMVGVVNDRTQKSGKGEHIWALNDISFAMDQGEIMGIIGKNGAGKSTLLKILSRVTYPTRGKITLQGRLAGLLEVGTGFHPEMTGRENIFMNGTIMGMRKKEIERKLDEIVDFAGVTKYLDTPVKRYSTGMTVRLGFAVAAFLEPEILVVDEVLAVGDAEFQRKAIGKMRDVSKESGRTVLFVSHNMQSIQHLCSRVLVLENGQLDYDGPVMEGIDRYLNRYRESAGQELTLRDDRQGKGNVKFTAIHFENGSGKTVHTINSGMDLVVRLAYSAAMPLQDVVFRIQVVDERGFSIFVCNNFQNGGAFTRLEANGEVKCTIPHLPLTDGKYYVHLQLLTNRDVEDEIEYAAEFTVEKGDFYGSGKVPKLNAAVLINHSWSHG